MNDLFLDESNLAEKALEAIMSKSFQFSHVMFRSGRSSVMDLSSKAKDSIYTLLSSKSEYHHSDLIIGLHCFSRDGTASQYRLFSVIEETIIPSIAHMRNTDLLTLFTSYAYVGRKFPDILKEIDLFLEKSFSKLTVPDLVRVIWCYARLFHKPKVLPLILEQIFSEISNNTRKDPYNACVLLWGLAVLEELTIEVQFCTNVRLK